MQVFWSILASIFILYVWIWAINAAFGKNSLKLQYIWKILLIGIILVGGLFSYKYLISHSRYQHYNLVDSLQNLNVKTLLLFASYCTIIVGALILIFRKRALLILQVFLGGALFFLLISYGGVLLGINGLILYYIITAYAEEYMKYTASTTLLGDASSEIKDGIFFCILLGLGFSLIENIVYLISLVDGSGNLLGIIIGRGLISALLHVVATTTIGALYYSLKQKIIRPVALFVSIAGGVILHGGYNIGLEYHLSYVTIPLVIFFFFLLSFFLFKSDLLYSAKLKPTENENKESLSLQ